MNLVTKSQKEAALLADADKFIGQINAAIDRAYTIPLCIYWSKIGIPLHVHGIVIQQLRLAGWQVSEEDRDHGDSFWKLS